MVYFWALNGGLGVSSLGDGFAWWGLVVVDGWWCCLWFGVLWLVV